MQIKIDTTTFAGKYYFPNRIDPQSGVQGHPLAIVNHITDSNDDPYGVPVGTGNYLARGGTASINYLIDQLGRIYQIVPPEHGAWGNGIVDRPNPAIKWLMDAVGHRNFDNTLNPINPNVLTLSIEHVGKPNPSGGASYSNFMNPVQVKASLDLHRYLFARFRSTMLPPSRQSVCRHGDIDSVNRPYCPPPNRFPLDYLIQQLQLNPEGSAKMHFDETEIDVKDGFLDLWNLMGNGIYENSVHAVGLPITPALVSKRSGLLTQVFERYVMEYDPTADEIWRVRGLDIGRQWLDQIGGTDKL